MFKNLLIKIKSNKIFLSFCVVSVATITIMCFVSMLMYYTNTKKMVNSFFNKSISAEQSLIITNLSDFEKELNRITYQVISNDSLYKIISGTDNDYNLYINAKNTSNVFINFNCLKNWYIMKYNDLTIFNNNLKIINSAEFENTIVSPAQIVKNHENGMRLFTIENDSTSLGLINYDFRGYYFIYIFDKALFFKNICTTTNNDYDFAIYYNNSLLFSTSDRIFSDYSNIDEKNAITSTIGKYNILSIPSINSANMFYSPFFKQLIIFVLILLLFAITMLVLSTSLFTSTTEKYIQNITSRNKQHHFAAIKSTMQKSLSNQFISKSDQEFVTNYLKQIGFDEIFCSYVQLDQIEHLLLSCSYEDIAKSMQNINAILQDELSSFGTCIVLDFNYDSIGLVLLASKVIQDTDVEESISNARKKIRELLSLTITITTTDSITLASDVFPTFIQLNQMKNYRFLTGFNSTITDKTKNSEENESFPEEIRKKIIAAMLSGDNQEFEASVDDFYNYLLKSSYLDSKQWLNELVLSLLKHSNFLQESTNILSRALHYDTLSDCIKFIKCSFCVNKTDSIDMSHISNNTFIEKVNNIIDNEYKNMDFNLSYLATVLDISVVYAGQKFKKLFNMSFNSYLARFRIEKSIKLLNNANYKNSELAELCGFSCAAYFIKTFKKVTSFTPSEYRRNYTGITDDLTKS